MPNITTVRDFCSSIKNTLKANNIDQHISNRYIYNLASDICGALIRQDANSKRIHKASDIWSTIGCFPLEKKNPIECCLGEVPECYFIMKSKYKLPATFTSNSGNIIREVSSILPVNKPFIGEKRPINSPMFFFPISGAKEYRNKINREYINPNIKYYWIEEDYILIPDAEIEAIRVVGYFIKPWEIIQLNFCDNTEDNCISPLDSSINMPTFLFATVKEEVIKTLMNSYEKVQEDASPDGSPNIKGLQKLVN